MKVLALVSCALLLHGVIARPQLGIGASLGSLGLQTSANLNSGLIGNTDANLNSDSRTGQSDELNTHANAKASGSSGIGSAYGANIGIEAGIGAEAASKQSAKSEGEMNEEATGLVNVRGAAGTTHGATNSTTSVHESSNLSTELRAHTKSETIVRRNITNASAATPGNTNIHTPRQSSSVDSGLSSQTLGDSPGLSAAVNSHSSRDTRFSNHDGTGTSAGEAYVNSNSQVDRSPSSSISGGLQSNSQLVSRPPVSISSTGQSSVTTTGLRTHALDQSVAQAPREAGAANLNSNQATSRPSNGLTGRLNVQPRGESKDQTVSSSITGGVKASSVYHGAPTASTQNEQSSNSANANTFTPGWPVTDSMNFNTNLQSQSQMSGVSPGMNFQSSGRINSNDLPAVNHNSASNAQTTSTPSSRLASNQQGIGNIPAQNNLNSGSSQLWASENAAPTFPSGTINSAVTNNKMQSTMLPAVSTAVSAALSSAVNINDESLGSMKIPNSRTEGTPLLNSVENTRIPSSQFTGSLSQRPTLNAMTGTASSSMTQDETISPLDAELKAHISGQLITRRSSPNSPSSAGAENGAISIPLSADVNAHLGSGTNRNLAEASTLDLRPSISPSINVMNSNELRTSKRGTVGTNTLPQSSNLNAQFLSRQGEGMPILNSVPSTNAREYFGTPETQIAAGTPLVANSNSRASIVPSLSTSNTVDNANFQINGNSLLSNTMMLGHDQMSTGGSANGNTLSQRANVRAVAKPLAANVNSNTVGSRVVPQAYGNFINNEISGGNAVGSSPDSNYQLVGRSSSLPTINAQTAIGLIPAPVSPVSATQMDMVPNFSVSPSSSLNLAQNAFIPSTSSNSQVPNSLTSPSSNFAIANTQPFIASPPNIPLQSVLTSGSSSYIPVMNSQISSPSSNLPVMNALSPSSSSANIALGSASLPSSGIPANTIADKAFVPSAPSSNFAVPNGFIPITTTSNIATAIPSVSTMLPVPGFSSNIPVSLPSNIATQNSLTPTLSFNIPASNAQTPIGYYSNAPFTTVANSGAFTNIPSPSNVITNGFSNIEGANQHSRNNQGASPFYSQVANPLMRNSGIQPLFTNQTVVETYETRSKKKEILTPMSVPSYYSNFVNTGTYPEANTQPIYQINTVPQMTSTSFTTAMPTGVQTLPTSLFQRMPASNIGVGVPITSSEQQPLANGLSFQSIGNMNTPTIYPESNAAFNSQVNWNRQLHPTTNNVVSNNPIALNSQPIFTTTGNIPSNTIAQTSQNISPTFQTGINSLPSRGDTSQIAPSVMTNTQSALQSISNPSLQYADSFTANTASQPMLNNNINNSPGNVLPLRLTTNNQLSLNSEPSRTFIGNIPSNAAVNTAVQTNYNVSPGFQTGLNALGSGGVTSQNGNAQFQTMNRPIRSESVLNPSVQFSSQVSSNWSPQSSPVFSTASTNEMNPNIWGNSAGQVNANVQNQNNGISSGSSSSPKLERRMNAGVSGGIQVSGSRTNEANFGRINPAQEMQTANLNSQSNFGQSSPVTASQGSNNEVNIVPNINIASSAHSDSVSQGPSSTALSARVNASMGEHSTQWNERQQQSPANQATLNSESGASAVVNAQSSSPTNNINQYPVTRPSTSASTPTNGRIQTAPAVNTELQLSSSTNVGGNGRVSGAQSGHVDTRQQTNQGQVGVAGNSGQGSTSTSSTALNANISAGLNNRAQTAGSENVGSSTSNFVNSNRGSAGLSAGLLQLG